MNKLIFPFIIVAVVVLAFVIKLNYKEKVLNDAETTNGKVLREFQRGKLPYCEFTYTVDSVEYHKKQEVPMHLKNKVLDSTYTVYYDIDNPKNAILKFK
ncbi:hypothetical protein AXE80_02840 [Wenyingzhuangia fucanilytica]|uniref:DUF3592 domain-containing protein n=1 Tax=Wenyingzhuangia fucanilytica TaxID=1790137 RepID=A0A1B1Y3F9_9FLAO|nr:hypothetical protein [Wenyingzhuangia fucanilytica]ANW95287.1 hypothetical protein AXE80_02840 [Wenyingzhuangia fucanilytica]